MASSGPIILSYGDSLIRQSEVEILRRNGWLNDIIMSFFFEVLEERCKPPLKDHVKFYAATLSQFVKFCDKPEEVATFFGDTNPSNVQYAFWPINDSSSRTEESAGSHWSLLVYSRPDNAFLHYDSVRNSGNSAEATKVFEKLRMFFSRTAAYKIMTDTTQQANSSDCGLHVLANAEKILHAIISRKGTNLRWTQITNRGAAVGTADYNEVCRFRTNLLDLIQRLASEERAKREAQQQAQAPRLPAQQLPAPRLPAQQLPPQELAAPWLLPQQLPPQQLPAPWLPAQQLPPQELAAPWLPPQELAVPWLPPQQLAAPWVPAQQLAAPWVPVQQLPAPRLHAPQILAPPPVESVQRDLASMHLNYAEEDSYENL